MTVVRGRPARRRRGNKRPLGECMCNAPMAQLTPGYFWCPKCGRLREQNPGTGKWKFATPRGDT